MAQSRKSQQTRKARAERIRREKHGEQKPAEPRRASSFDGERRLLAAARLQDELGTRAATGDAREEAQELAFQALEADPPEEAKELAQRALALDTDCLDALHALASAEATTPEERAERLKALLPQAEARLKAQTRPESLGHGWNQVELRPCLRLFMACGAALEHLGRFGEAAPLFERLLECNLDDPQGARFYLVRCYLMSHKLKELQRLLQRFETDPSPVLAWAAVLERIQSRSLLGAAKLLPKAREANPIVEEFLTARRRLPRNGTPLGHYPAGSEEEAITAMRFVGEAWLNDRTAMYWLFQGGVAGSPN